MELSLGLLMHHYQDPGFRIRLKNDSAQRHTVTCQGKVRGCPLKGALCFGMCKVPGVVADNGSSSPRHLWESFS